MTVHTLELMLNVEQPSVDDMGEKKRSQRDEKKSVPANNEKKTGDYDEQRGVLCVKNCGRQRANLCGLFVFGNQRCHELLD